MISLRKFAAFALLITSALDSASALALSVGDGGELADMESRLTSEHQVEIMTASTGLLPNLRGLKFFYDPTNKVGYVGMTDNPIRPTKMKIVAKTSNTAPGAPPSVPPAITSIRDCQRLVGAGQAEKSNCASLASVLETEREKSYQVFQHGNTADGNVLISTVNVATGVGAIFESTTAGATVVKLPFASGKMTPAGLRMLDQ